MFTKLYWKNVLISVWFVHAVSVKINKNENVLIVIADDLRPLLPDWGDQLAQTPNINSLAGKSIIFKNAFAQQALCAPSRNSFLTSRRPDTLHLYDFYSYWRHTVGNFTTMPQYFKENGYLTHSIGKIFHPGISSNYTDDYPYSWSEMPYHPTSEKFKESPVCRGENDSKYHRNLICPVVVDFQPEGTLPDIQSTKEAVKFLKSRKYSSNQPFFLAVGLHKPHLPLKYPEKYLELYPLDKILLPENYGMPYKLPYPAWNPWTDVRNRDDIRSLNISFPYGQIPDIWAKKIIQSYYASISYVDDLIGQILKNVNFKETIVVLMSDHGWSLGEHGEWSKFSNFDVALKVPLIVYVPNRDKHPMKAQIIDNIVELVDIFPTLAELTNISVKFPICSSKFKTDIRVLCAEGKSLVPLILGKSDHNNKHVKYMAYSQYPRPGYYPTLKPNSDKPRLKNIKIMGYTLRTKRYRYTEWVSFNHSTFTPNFETSYGIELYDHFIDKNESLNLIDRNQMSHVADSLSKLLKKKFSFSL